MTAPIEVSGAEVEAQPDALLSGLGKRIEGRSLGQIAWMRFRRDKVAVGGGVVVILLIVIAVATQIWIKVTGHPPFGHPPNEYHTDRIDPVLSTPKGSFGGITGSFLLGVDPNNGRDLYSRILDGAWYSLMIAFLATLLSVFLGVVLGMVSGYFGRWVDTLIARTMDVFLAFPILVFAIALTGVMPDSAFGLKGNTLRVAVLIFIIGFFNWPYIGRIIRGQTISLREREFVDAARGLGARPSYIIFREILPNLVAPIIVYSTLLIPTNILFEAALSFLGVGIVPPTPSWGGMLSDAVGIYNADPWFMLFPGLAIFITVMAFNLFGDGLRDALDPRANR